MKNSVWYRKLWLKKLDELPVKANADGGWALMQQQLNAHLPASKPNAGGAVAKPLVSKLIALAGYVLPAAAMVGVASYFAVTTGVKPKPVLKKVYKTEYHVNKALDNSKTSIETDAATGDSLAAYAPASPSITNTQMTKLGIDSGGRPGIKAISPGKEVKTKPDSGQSASINSSLAHLNELGGKAITKLSGNNDRDVINSRRFLSAARHGLGNHHRNTIRTRYLSNADGKHTIQSLSAKQPRGFRMRNYADLSQELISYGGNASQQSIPKAENGSRSNNYVLPKIQYLDNRIDLRGGTDPDKTIDSKKRVVKPKRDKALKSLASGNVVTPAYNYGLQAGLNAGSGGAGFYLGLTGNYAFTKRWFIEGSVVYNGSRTLSGTYTHPSIYRPDSSSAILLNDSRKVQPIDIMLNLQYRVSKLVSVKAGPVLSYAGKQLNTSTRLGTVGSFRDTLGYSKTIDSVRNTTVFNKKMNLGFTGGLGVKIKQFELNARYLWLPPYKVSNSWGTYSQPANRLQIGVSYLFK